MTQLSQIAQLPQALKDASLWAISDPNKVPLDPKLFAYGLREGISNLKDLLTLDQLEQLNLPSGYQPALRLNARKNHYIFIDIEPLAVKNNLAKKYLNLPYLYLEYSRNKGLHGILQLDPKIMQEFKDNLDENQKPFYEKTVYKDEESDTEIIMNRHYITLTGHTIPLPDPSQVQDIRPILEEMQAYFDRQVLDENLSISQITQGKDFLDQDLNPILQPVFDTAIKHVDFLVHPHQKLENTSFGPKLDKSREEFTRLNQMWLEVTNSSFKKVVHHAPIEDQILLLTKMAQLALPFRKKHLSMRRSSEYNDEVPYLIYVCRNIVVSRLNAYNQWLINHNLDPIEPKKKDK